MDALMLNPHQDHPGRTLPVQRQRQRHLFNKLDHPTTDLAPIVMQFRHRRPVIMTVIQIVPAHFIDTNRQHRFDMVIDTLIDKPRRHQLVNIEGGGVAVIEDQRMAQRDRFGEVSPFIRQAVEQTLIQFPGLLEIAQDFITLLLDIAPAQQQGARCGG